MATNAVQAKNVAASNYTYRAESQIETNVESMGFFSYTAIVGEPVFFENYNAAIYNTRALLGVTNVATNVSFRCDTYIFPIALSNSWTIWASDNPSENTFDANGHFSGNTPHRIDAFSGVGSNGWFQAAAWYGGSAPLSSSLPAWADVPPWDGTNENKRARGCKADFGAVLWWQFKNK